MTKTSPSKIDLFIGQNLKLKRIQSGISLQELGKVLNVSFQQIQKYERGQNKISSSSLFLLADSLKCEIDYFFKGIDNKDHKQTKLKEEKEIFQHIDSIPNHEITQLVKYYSQIRDPNVRKKTLDLIKTLCRVEEIEDC
ncbi:MAG: helix-turn-helix domain-containing protein [Alphaproteobacteria bacterium]|nr:helix-turn-helix domain-containing protein [Alphaproteobacteria bacterium]